MAATQARQRSEGPNWRLYSIISVGVLVAAGVALIAFLALSGGGGDTEASTGGDDDPAQTPATVATATPTEAPTEVPTQTPVPPTPTSVPVPTFEELHAQLLPLKATVVAVTGGLNPADRANINDSFDRAVTELTGVSTRPRPGQTPSQIRGNAVQDLANKAAILGSYACQNPSDTAAVGAFKEFRSYLLQLSDRLWQDGLVNDPVKEAVETLILQRIGSCKLS